MSVKQLDVLDGILGISDQASLDSTPVPVLTTVSVSVSVSVSTSRGRSVSGPGTICTGDIVMEENAMLSACGENMTSLFGPGPSITWADIFKDLIAARCRRRRFLLTRPVLMGDTPRAFAAIPFMSSTAPQKIWG
jgi:hypothetical protein